MMRLVWLSMGFAIACATGRTSTPTPSQPPPFASGPGVVAVWGHGVRVAAMPGVGGAQVCAAGASCAFSCDQGNCAFICESGSSCNIECDGGNCMMECEPGASCNEACDGGNCRTLCDGGASCNLECDGGQCQQACEAGASCNTECDGGGCDGLATR